MRPHCEILFSIFLRSRFMLLLLYFSIQLNMSAPTMVLAFVVHYGIHTSITFLRISSLDLIMFTIL